MRLPVSICMPDTWARVATFRPLPTHTQSSPMCLLHVAAALRSFTRSRKRASRGPASAARIPSTENAANAENHLRMSTSLQRVRPGSGPFLDLERDPLRQRQLATPVDGVGLAAHVRLPGVGPRLTTTARVFLAAERATDLGARGANVHVGDATVTAGGRQERFSVLQPVREDCR